MQRAYHAAYIAPSPPPSYDDDPSATITTTSTTNQPSRLCTLTHSLRLLAPLFYPPPPPPSFPSPTDDIAALRPLLTHLKHATERALGGPRNTMHSGADAAYYDRTMLGALAATGLRPAQGWDPPPAHVMPSAAAAAVGASRFDWMKDWDDDVLVVVVEVTVRAEEVKKEEEKGGLGVVTVVVMESWLGTLGVGMEEVGRRGG